MAKHTPTFWALKSSTESENRESPRHLAGDDSLGNGAPIMPGASTCSMSHSDREAAPESVSPSL